MKVFFTRISKQVLFLEICGLKKQKIESEVVNKWVGHSVYAKSTPPLPPNVSDGPAKSRAPQLPMSLSSLYIVLDFIFTKACRILYMEVFRDLSSEEKVESGDGRDEKNVLIYFLNEHS